MKSSVFFILSLLVVSPLYAQNFLGEDAQFYRGAIVKPIEIAEGLRDYHYKNFYLSFDTINKTFVKKSEGRKATDTKPFQTGNEYSPVSDYAKMVGLEFEVVNVYRVSSVYSFDKNYCLELKNTTLGTVYYEYDSSFEFNFELQIVSGLNLPDDYWCTKFRVVNDKFEDKVSHYSPPEAGISFAKFIENDQTSVYLSVQVNGSTLNVGEKGLILLFEDGSKLNWPDADIDTDVAERSGYTYSAFVKLTKSDLEKFSTLKVTDKRLYIYDGSIRSEFSPKIMLYAACLADDI